MSNHASLGRDRLTRMNDNDTVRKSVMHHPVVIQENHVSPARLNDKPARFKTMPVQSSSAEDIPTIDKIKNALAPDKEDAKQATDSGGIMSSIYSLFGGAKDKEDEEQKATEEKDMNELIEDEIERYHQGNLRILEEYARKRMRRLSE